MPEILAAEPIEFHELRGKAFVTLEGGALQKDLLLRQSQAGSPDTAISQARACRGCHRWDAEASQSALPWATKTEASRWQARRPSQTPATGAAFLGTFGHSPCNGTAQASPPRPRDARPPAAQCARV
eukprot:scaffold7066_cov253-Pinguiococcus_pyrenoidosus.AAC.3